MASQLPPGILNLLAHLNRGPVVPPQVGAGVPQRSLAQVPSGPLSLGQPASGPVVAPAVGPNVPGQYQAPPDVGPHQVSQPINPVLLALGQIGQGGANPGAALHGQNSSLRQQQLRALLDQFLARLGASQHHYTMPQEQLQLAGGNGLRHLFQ